MINKQRVAKMRSTKHVLAVLLVLTLAACDESKQKSVEAPKQPTAIEVNLRVLELAKAGKPIDALRVGEEFFRAGSDPDGALHSTLAKLYTELGDTESAVRHLQQSGPAANTSTTGPVLGASKNASTASARTV